MIGGSKAKFLRVQRETLNKRTCEKKYEVLQQSGCLLWDRKPHTVKGCVEKNVQVT
jgi:hypothetical protein